MFGVAPNVLGLRQELLWKVGGGQFQGYLFRDHVAFASFGVQYKYWHRVNANQKEICMAPGDNLRAAQHQDVWNRITGPSSDEHAEVSHVLQPLDLTKLRFGNLIVKCFLGFDAF